jgi:hypothetical protein
MEPATSANSGFMDFARQHTSLHWYAIADSAQHKSLPAVLETPGRQVRCLFDVSQQSSVAEYAPHLVEIDSPLKDSRAWKWITRNAKAKPCVSVIATALGFDTLYGHLVNFIEVELPDKETMFFAFWDPAILGALVGNCNDFSLHVKGPVLTAAQRNLLLGDMTRWWYWGRNKTLQELAGDNCDEPPAVLPLKLGQRQVDDLVEASVPDHVLYYLETNQPLIFEKISAKDRYEFVRQSLADAREIGLTLMGDIVNFVCVKLIYEGRIKENDVRDIFEKVKKGEISFSAAITQLS